MSHYFLNKNKRKFVYDTTMNNYYIIRKHFREEHQSTLTYYLPDRSVPWSRMFGIMEKAKRELDVEDYSILQTNLEQIFLQFTKYQRDQSSSS